MSCSPTPSSVQTWSTWSRSSSALSYSSVSSSSSYAFPSRYCELLAKFPLPPQGRNIENQIGLFPAVYTLPYQVHSLESTRPLSPASFHASATTPSDLEKDVYAGLGIQSDGAYDDVRESVANISLKSSSSSIISEHRDREERSSHTDDEDSSVSSLSTNPIIIQIRSWTPHDVAAFMESRGFRIQAPNFIHHEITGAILLELDLAMLKEVDISAFGIRYGIIREIEGLKKLARNYVSKPPKSEASFRAPSRSTIAEEEDPDSYERPYRNRTSTGRRQLRLTPTRSHYRRSSHGPPTPRSDAQSITPEPFAPGNRTSVVYPAMGGHRSTKSQDSGFSASTHGSLDVVDKRRSHFRNNSTALTQENPSGPRSRMDSHDSGLGHSRHTSTDTVIRSPGVSGHKRQSSSLATVKAYMGKKEEGPAKGQFAGQVVLQGTRSESPNVMKPSARFFITPNSIRSNATGKGGSGDSGIRLVKSYSALRNRRSSTGSNTPADETPSPGGDLHQHRSVLLKTVPAKEASLKADYSGWLKKRTERGSSIAGISVGPGAGIVGGWKRRWFVLKGRRLSYYHSDKVVPSSVVLTIGC
jgi:SAM domain (Sterile alpha motif)/PH domain